MSTSSYCIRLTKAMNDIAKRYSTTKVDDTNPQDGDSPPFENRYPQKVAIERNLKRSNGPSAVIDVQPDYRNIILYLVHYITRTYPSLDVKDAPALTPTSLLGYTLAIVYSLALLNDDENVRSQRSTHAREFSNDADLAEHINDIRQLAVPKFMLDLLNELGVGSDDRKPELKFCYNLACFDFTLDFGRALPINIFFIASHLIASLPSNTPPNDVLQLWYQSQVINTPENCRVYHYLGANPAQVYQTN